MNAPRSRGAGMSIAGGTCRPPGLRSEGHEGKTRASVPGGDVMGGRRTSHGHSPLAGADDLKAFASGLAEGGVDRQGGSRLPPGGGQRHRGPVKDHQVGLRFEDCLEAGRTHGQPLSGRNEGAKHSPVDAAARGHAQLRETGSEPYPQSIWNADRFEGVPDAGPPTIAASGTARWRCSDVTCMVNQAPSAGN